jgi:Protein of unknown function (DUF3108)
MFKCGAVLLGKPAMKAVGVVATLTLAATAMEVPAAPVDTPQSFRSEYFVSYLGFTIARSSFESTVSRSSFRVNGSLSSAGIAEIFDDTKGTTSVSGRFAGGSALPTAFVANYTSGRKAKKIAISFANGAVSKTVNMPPLKKRGSDWVPVGAGHLKGVADPLSAALVRADSAEAVCNRTLKIFDGEMRANLALSPVSVGPSPVRGYEGETVTCQANFTPVAGYRKGHKSIEYLKNRSKIRITFAPLAATGVYAPIYATVGTRIGTVTIRARRVATAQ